MKSLFSFLMSKGQMGALLLGLLCIIIVLGSIYGGLGSAGYDVGTDLNAILKDGGGDGFNFFNMAIAIPIVLIGIAFVCWVGFTIIQLISDPKSSMKILITLGIIAVLFVVLMSISESETTGKIAALLQKNDIPEGASKAISGGLKTTVLLAFGSAVAMFILEIYNMFK